MNRRRFGRICIAAVTLAACGGGEGPTSVPTNQPPPAMTTFPGFDAAAYPGAAAMRAWLYPASPYYWTGYYLAAPCHRDVSWTNTRATLAGMGWGITAVYVGQQDWTQIPSAAPIRRAVDVPASRVRLGASSNATAAAATCSASLLSSTQGSAEAADAIGRMKADGFPDGSTVFLDVEYVTTVTPALRDYYRGWIGGVLADGRYKPGVYAAKLNASSLNDEAVAAFKAAGRSDTPSFWIASSIGFSIGAKPSAVGFDFAKLWQGMFDVSQTWAGVPLTIDVDVATAKSPSMP